ncbi:MAG TPA: PAS domain-containing protein, partial [Cytophagaceae bacterium]|nr:PAS domain-containing protein [Cytophagaceae bacterium]
YHINAVDYFFSNIKNGKLGGSLIPFLQEGQFRYAIGLFQEIKDIDLLEVKISEQDFILRDIETLSGIGKWETNLKTNTVTWSEGMYHIFEIPLGSISRHKEFFQYVHPDDVERIRKVIDDVTQLKVSQSFEYRILTFGKDLKYISGRAQPVCDDKEEVIKIIGYCQDITKSKKIINELNTTLSFLLQSQAAARIGSFEWDIEARKFKATPEFYNIFEFEQGTEVDFDKLLERIHEKDRFRVYDCIQNSIKEMVSCEFAFNINLPSGKEVFCLCRAEIVEDKINKSKKFIGSIGDITERRLAEIKLLDANVMLEEKTNALKKLNEELENKVDERTHEIFLSNERFRLISEATQEAMWAWDIVNNTLWHNEALKIKFGFDKSTKTSQMQMWKSRLHPDDSERVLHGIFSAINSDVSNWKDEYRFMRVDGKYIFVIDRGFIIRNKDGKAVRMVGSMMEVSEINQIEKRLRESEENYRFLAESMPQLLWITNSKGECIYANSKWTEYTGQDFAAYKDFGAIRSIHPDDVDEVMKTWSESISTGKGFSMQYRLINKEGETRWFLVRSVPMFDEEGKIQRWIGTCTDIHDQKQIADNLIGAEKKLNNANTLLSRKNKRLKNINKDLDNFVYSATHDLRSPISNVEALLRLLHAEAMDQPSSGKFIDYFNLVFKSLDIVKVILNDLTEVVKVDDDQNALVETLSFIDIIEEVKVTLNDSIKSSEAKINIDFVVPDVKFLRKNLRSIFYNILSNAIKYRARERDLIINIKTQKDDEYTFLSISDNGIGIREKDLEKVFLPFKRINYDIEGTGIGMWIMKRIIENNGGKIEVESEVDKGTTFKIYFKN